MSWNHRVFKEKYAEDWYGYSIREVYYHMGGICNQKKKGKQCTHKPTAYTKEAITPGSETLEGLRQELTWMLQALDQPILSEADFKSKPKRKKK